MVASEVSVSISTNKHLRLLEILKETMKNEAWITYETLSLSVYLRPISLGGPTCKYATGFDKPCLSLHQSNNENSIDGKDLLMEVFLKFLDVLLLLSYIKNV